MPEHRRHGQADRRRHGSPWGIPLRPSSTHYNPPGKLLRHPLDLSSPTSPPFPHRNLATVELFSPPILLATGSHSPPVLLSNQGYPKVRHDPLNLPSAGYPLRRNAVVFFLSSVFPDQGLNCFDLEGSRVFSVKFPEPSLFQISELLNSIEMRKKFIKIQNQFCLNP
jgi:hypothetical protein